MNKLLLSACAMLFIALCPAVAGEPTVVIDPDFSVFGGSEEEPVELKSYGTGSLGSYEGFASWTAKNTTAVGGKLLMADGGQVQTAYMNLSANGGVYKVICHVKAMDPTGGILQVKVGYSTSEQVILENNQWTDVELLLSGGNSMSKLTLAPFLCASGIEVDRIAVLQSDEYFVAPVATQPSIVEDDYFYATWKKVTNATAYFLDVYSYNNGEKEYLLDNQDCGTATSYRVGDLVQGKTYFYVVRATNGTVTSLNSNEIEVVPVVSSLPAPTGLVGTASAEGFTASWDAVEKAKGYLVTVYSHETLAEAGIADVISEDFSLITTGSLSSTDYGSSFQMDSYTHTPGWICSISPALAAGYFVLAPFGSEADIITPQLNLSAAEGQFSVTVEMAAVNYGTKVSGEQVTIALLNADGETVESQEVTLGGDFAPYTVNFTQGTAQSKVRVLYSGNYKVFLDMIAVRQMLDAGSMVVKKVDEQEVEGTTVTLPYTNSANVEYGFTVTAWANTVSDGEIVPVYSPESEEQMVGAETVAIEKTYGASTLRVRQGFVAITTAQPTTVNVYSIDGRLISTTHVGEGETLIPTGTKGVKVVKAEGKTLKIKN